MSKRKANLTADILQTAGDIVNYIGWTKGDYAKDAYENPVSAWHDAATCFCAVGAIRLASQMAVGSTKRLYEEATECTNTLKKVLGGEFEFVYVPKWNDARTRKKADVVEALYAAAELAREEVA